MVIVSGLLSKRLLMFLTDFLIDAATLITVKWDLLLEIEWHVWVYQQPRLLTKHDCHLIALSNRCSAFLSYFTLLIDGVAYSLCFMYKDLKLKTHHINISLPLLWQNLGWVPLLKSSWINKTWSPDTTMMDVVLYNFTQSDVHCIIKASLYGESCSFSY